MKISKYFKPVGWTKDTNRTGFLKGTYDLLSVWNYGPDKVPLSNLAVYTEIEVEEILKKLGITEEDLIRRLN